MGIRDGKTSNLLVDALKHEHLQLQACKTGLGLAGNGVIYGLYREYCIGYKIGLYIGIMEKKMETTIGLIA